MNQLYIVEQYISGEGNTIISSFQGIFDSEEKARVACRTDMYCYFPANLNEELSHEPFEAPDCKYPLRGE